MIQDDAPTPAPERRSDTLERMSIEELERKIVELREQIAACERIIESKRGHMAAADAFFASRTT
jgi:uncharacterized small protein (DUF1192 family)